MKRLFFSIVMILATALTACTSSTNSSDKTVNVSSGSASGGGMPAGGPPADGGGAPDGGMPADMGGSAPASSTDQTQSADTTSGLAETTEVPFALVEAVIQSLQQKIAA